MKILYGIQGTGNGHISRSTKIIHRLKKVGCNVDILISGNTNINIPFEVKYNLTGFTLKYSKNGSISFLKTLINLNFYKFINDLKLNLNNYDLIISDFEPITAWASKINNKECLGISNQCSFLSKNSPRPKQKSYIGEFIFKNMAPVSKKIGFHFEEYDTFIYTPIIKDTLLIFKPTEKNHYTVYLPTYDLDILNGFLSKLNVKFHVFSNIENKIISNNITYYPLNKYRFEDSILNSSGVITSGGFQTTSESLFLNKKLMTIPINGQYEQLCNVESLKKLGVFSGTLNDISYFLDVPKQSPVNWEDSTNKVIDFILSH